MLLGNGTCWDSTVFFDDTDTTIGNCSVDDSCSLITYDSELSYSNLTEDNVEAYIFDDDNTANLGMGNYNVTNVSYTTFCNGANCWKMYVNASDYFIIEEI